MATIGENLRAFLIASTGVDALFDDIEADKVVLQNQIPQKPPKPRIFYRRNSGVEDPFLDGTVTAEESTWDIECISDDVDESINIAEAVKLALNAHRGTFGANTIQGAFVLDHDDNYVIKGLSQGEGIGDGTFLAALSVTIFST